MLDTGPTIHLVAQPAPPLPVARLIVGRSTDEVAALLPRVFNLCRAAQKTAVEAALGRTVSGDGIVEEILRDHMVKFCVTWPAFFGNPPSQLPVDWAAGGRSLRASVFGPALAAPTTAAEFFSFLDSGSGISPLLQKIDGCFAPGEAVAAGLAPVSNANMWSSDPVENSVAARVADHPAMRGIAQARGQGPLWRAAARLFDLEAWISGREPVIFRPGPGAAIVPAARGSYAIRLTHRGGIVTDFNRVTPTDHLLARDGVLDRVLATFPAQKAGLGPLLLDILDPCSPVRLKEARHA